jgi:hypothetical protein
VPADLEHVVGTVPAEIFANYDPHHITGCVLSGLLSSQRAGLRPTIGLASLRACLAHYRGVTGLGFKAAALHCDGFVPEEETIRNFRRRFGREADETMPAAALAGGILP